MKFSIRTIPAAAAMAAALMFGAQAHAQTTTQPTTAEGGKAAIPEGPSAGAKTPAQRDAAKPMGREGMDAGSTSTGGSANMPAGPNTMGKSMQQRDMAKPMGKQGGMAGSMGTGDSAAMPPGGADQPVRQSGKVAKNKAERMEKGSNPKSPKNKSNEPVRESDLKDMPAK